MTLGLPDIQIESVSTATYCADAACPEIEEFVFRDGERYWELRDTNHSGRGLRINDISELDELIAIAETWGQQLEQRKHGPLQGPIPKNGETITEISVKEGTTYVSVFIDGELHTERSKKNEGLPNNQRSVSFPQEDFPQLILQLTTLREELGQEQELGQETAPAALALV